MTTLVRPGVPGGGFKTVGQLHATNNLVFRRNQNAMEVAVELLATHRPGAPVLGERGEFIGFVSEFDILRVLEAKKDLNQLTAADVMAKEHIAVTNETSIDEADSNDGPHNFDPQSEAGCWKCDWEGTVADCKAAGAK